MVYQRGYANHQDRYSESFEYLYSANNFATIHPDCIQFIDHLFYPHQLDLIRSIKFKWYSPGKPVFPPPEGHLLAEGPHSRNYVWNSVWKSLADLKGLQELHVKLFVAAYLWEDMNAAEVIALIKPIVAVTRPTFFELGLPFANRDNALWEGLPCHIRRTENGL